MAAAWGQPPYRLVAIILAVLIPLYSNLLYDLDLTGVSTSIPVQNMETATRAAAILALAGAATLLTTHRLRGIPGRLLATFCVPAVIGGTLFHLNALRSLDRWTFGFGPSPLIDDGLAQIFHTLDRWAPEGLSWILFLLAVTIATDTAAYFVGKAIGKRKLAPEISPNKTWEGAVGGFCGAVAVGVAIESRSASPPTSPRSPSWPPSSASPANSATSSSPDSSAAPASTTPAPSSPDTAASSTGWIP